MEQNKIKLYIFLQTECRHDDLSSQSNNKRFCFDLTKQNKKGEHYKREI